MHIDLDRTQEWLNRTQSFPRTPPVRGGVGVDRKARRQTSVGIAIVAVALLLLALIPRPDRTTSTKSDRAGQLVTAETNHLLAVSLQSELDSRSAKPRRPQTGTRALSSPRTYHSYYSAPYYDRTDADHIAPSAPVWLVTMPKEWDRMDVPVIPTSNSLLNSARALREQ